ncbi:MAG: hypothetical protein WD139_14515 [Balneolaceae bacterium]
MIEPVVVAKIIISGIIRRIDVNQLHFPGKLLFQGVQRQQVVAFNDIVVFI